MGFELAAIILSTLSPVLTAYAVYLTRRARATMASYISNDMPHLLARLDLIEERLTRLENVVLLHREEP